MSLAVWIEWGTQPTDFSTKEVQASKCFNSFISYEAVVIAESSEHLDCVEQTLSLRSSLLCLIAECIDIVITMYYHVSLSQCMEKSSASKLCAMLLIFMKKHLFSAMYITQMLLRLIPNKRMRNIPIVMCIHPCTCVGQREYRAIECPHIIWYIISSITGKLYSN